MTSTPTAHAGSAPALDRLREQVAEGRLGTVLLAVPDMQGRLKGKRHDARHFLGHLAGDGAEMCAYVLATDHDMHPLPGYALTSWDDGYGDMRIVPDPGTLRVLPWVPGAALLLADPVGPDGTPVPVAPRQVLRHQLDRLAAAGYTALAGVETEFMLYKGTYAEHAANGFRDLRPAADVNLDYALDHDLVNEGFFDALATGLAGAGLPVEAVKTEAGLGQVEVTFPYGDPLAACDGHTVFKHAARRYAERAGLSATFMAAPATGLANGLHLHISLYRQDGAPVLPERGPRELALAGLLDALPGLAPLYAPYPNSYKRFTVDSFAPTRLTWGTDNRTCAIRVTGHGDNTHIEVRVPGADANPYLALSAALAALTHGLTTPGLPLPPAFTGNAYLAEDAPAIPATLDAALDAFRASQQAREALGDEVHAHYAHYAALEAAADRATVTDADLRRGFTRA
jgi:glutamine synthetase